MMKKFISLLLVSLMALSLLACVKNKTTENKLTESQQLVIDAVNATLQTDAFSDWESLYKEFTGNDPKTPEVTSVVHYEIDDFEGEKVDCYLVNVSADVAYWMNEEAEQGAVDENFQIFIDSTTKSSYDSITTNASNVEHDFSTDEGKVTYLLWLFGNMQDGSFNGNFLNDMETVIELTDDDIVVINNNLSTN